MILLQFSLLFFTCCELPRVRGGSVHSLAADHSELVSLVSDIVERKLEEEREKWKKERQNCESERLQWLEEKQNWQHEKQQWMREKQAFLQEWQTEKQTWQEERLTFQISLKEWQSEKQHWLEEKQQWQHERRQWQGEKLEYQNQLKEWQREMVTSRHKVLSATAKKTPIPASSSPLQSLSKTAGKGHTHVSAVLSDSRSGQPNTVKTAVAQSKRKDTLQSSVLSDSRTSRSDDPNALQGVVSQMEQRVSEMGAQLQALQNADLQHNLAILQAASTAFVRWGSSTCPNSTKLVYTGYVGGAFWDQPGSSNTVLCLPTNPVAGSFFDRPSPYISELYGAELATNDAHYYLDPVCAVCLTQGRSASVMIPATTVCPGGWTLDYSGYLMGSYPKDPVGHDFVCVDSAMEPRPSSAGGSNGLKLFYTYSHCGSLPCPPYTDNKLVACVVCSK